MIIIVFIIIGVLIGPAFILAITGYSMRARKPERAKIFYILAASYVLISGGICASLIMGA